MLKFHLDEHVHPAIAASLRCHGINVTTTIETSLRGRSDAEHVAWAPAQGCVIVTHDNDYLRLHARGVAHAGIAYCHQGSRTIGEMLGLLMMMNECLQPREMAGRVEFL